MESLAERFVNKLQCKKFLQRPNTVTEINQLRLFTTGKFDDDAFRLQTTLVTTQYILHISIAFTTILVLHVFSQGFRKKKEQIENEIVTYTCQRQVHSHHK